MEVSLVTGKTYLWVGRPLPRLITGTVHRMVHHDLLYNNCIILWMVAKSCPSWKRWFIMVYPIIYRVSTSFNHPFGAGFRNHPQLGYPAHFESSGWGLTNVFVKLPSGEISWTNQIWWNRTNNVWEFISSMETYIEYIHIIYITYI